MFKSVEICPPLSGPIIRFTHAPPSRYTRFSQHDVVFVLINLLCHTAVCGRTVGRNENPACVARSVRLIRVLIEPLLLPSQTAGKKGSVAATSRTKFNFFRLLAAFWFILRYTDIYVRCLLHTNVRYSDASCLLYCFSSVSHRIAAMQRVR